MTVAKRYVGLAKWLAIGMILVNTMAIVVALLFVVYPIRNARFWLTLLIVGAAIANIILYLLARHRLGGGTNGS